MIRQMERPPTEAAFFLSWDILDILNTERIVVNFKKPPRFCRRCRSFGLRRGLVGAADDGIEFVDTQFISGEVLNGLRLGRCKAPSFEDPDRIANQDIPE
jgi:hypothetical protein